MPSGAHLSWEGTSRLLANRVSAKSRRSSAAESIRYDFSFAFRAAFSSPSKAESTALTSKGSDGKRTITAGSVGRCSRVTETPVHVSQENSLGMILSRIERTRRWRTLRNRHLARGNQRRPGIDLGSRTAAAPAISFANCFIAHGNRAAHAHDSRPCSVRFPRPSVHPPPQGRMRVVAASVSCSWPAFALPAALERPRRGSTAGRPSSVLPRRRSA